MVQILARTLSLVAASIVYCLLQNLIQMTSHRLQQPKQQWQQINQPLTINKQTIIMTIHCASSHSLVSYPISGGTTCVRLTNSSIS